MSSDIALSVQSLHAGYHRNEVVKDVSFEIKKGEVFGLVGLNGAGKTTLIKTILGLREKFSGDIVLQDGKAGFSYLPERFDPPWFLSGFDFIKFSLELYKQKISLSDAREAVEKLSLNSEFLEKRVNSYSKGMRQKLGLIANFLTQAPLLILDEPMSGLDPKARQEVKAIIKETKASNRSVFMSSHILADVAELCDRVAVFHNKTIIFIGTPKEMLKKAGEDDIERAFLKLIEA